MEQAVTDVTQASHKLAEVVYQQSPGAGDQPGSEPAAGEAEDDEVIDAEFVDVDEEAH